jgi:hypothetical protein
VLDHARYVPKARFHLSFAQVNVLRLRVCKTVGCSRRIIRKAPDLIHCRIQPYMNQGHALRARQAASGQALSMSADHRRGGARERTAGPPPGRGWKGGTRRWQAAAPHPPAGGPRPSRTSVAAPARASRAVRILFPTACVLPAGVAIPAGRAVGRPAWRPWHATASGRAALG